MVCGSTNLLGWFTCPTYIPLQGAADMGGLSAFCFVSRGHEVRLGGMSH
jgi:hypothetical protein